MEKKSILFVRHKPDVFNLGDFLCTPRHYFDFQLKEFENWRLCKSHKYVVVLGGGVHPDFGVDRKFPPEKSIAWGIGNSIHGETAMPPKTSDLPYKLYGIRDPDSISDEKFLLPCVSCMHPLVLLKPGTETNIFLNKDSEITDLKFIHDKGLFKRYKMNVYTNSMSECSFMKIFAKTKRVVTNSYHITYWSLLSGREVAVLGYSSKFRSLLKLFGISQENVNYYSAEQSGAIGELVGKAIETNSFIKVDNYDEIRSSFIRKNMDFAELCVKEGLFPSYKLKSQSKSRMHLRILEYRIMQIVTFWVKTIVSVLHRIRILRWKLIAKLRNK